MKKQSRSKSSAYALISVSDKTGVCEFAQKLTTLGYKIISTGGTAKALGEAHIPVVPIQEITGNPESFDGRMKTISFQIESAILYDRTNPKHVKEAKKLHVKSIDLVVCNLYPFEKTVSKSTVTLDDAIESVDVGGPTMVRAAGKNFKNVLVVIDPNDYKTVAEALEHKKVTQEYRQALAAKAFAHLSFYDSQIAKFFGKELHPNELTIAGRRVLTLRYGENPHQSAALYREPNAVTAMANLTYLGGRELSLINVTDINAGIESVRLFSETAAVVIKHNSACGIALGKTPEEALKRAIDADPESAFGGIIVLNKPLTLKAAKRIAHFKDDRKGNIDIVAAPAINSDAVAFLKTVRKTMGLYQFGAIAKHPVDHNIKWVEGGFVYQQSDTGIEKGFEKWDVVTKKKPSQKQINQMKIAWKFITKIRSNAIIIVDKNIPMTRGIGSGQTSRFRSTKLALEQAGKYAKGAILASDSFFPFDDTVKLAHKYKIAAIVEQGGSINDKASIIAANRAGIPMVFTHRRAFWH